MLVTRLNNGVTDITVYSYGKSMYGGWYADFYYTYDGERHIDGIRREKLSDLCSELHVSRTALQRDVTRFDNI